RTAPPFFRGRVTPEITRQALSHTLRSRASGPGPLRCLDRMLDARVLVAPIGAGDTRSHTGTRRQRTVLHPAMQIADSVALVTGGASGLGEATVRLIVHGGGRAMILDRAG